MLTMCERYATVPRGRKIVSERLLCTLVLMACALSIVSSVATMSLVAFKDASPAGGEHLEYASTYIGLDSVYRNPAAIPPHPLRGFPIVVGIVNRLQPTTSYPDTPSWESTFGTVYTADRAIRMSSAVRISSPRSLAMRSRKLCTGDHHSSILGWRLRHGALLPGVHSPCFCSGGDCLHRGVAR